MDHRVLQYGSAKVRLRSRSPNDDRGTNSIGLFSRILPSQSKFRDADLYDGAASASADRPHRVIVPNERLVVQSLSNIEGRTNELSKNKYAPLSHHGWSLDRVGIKGYTLRGVYSVAMFCFVFFPKLRLPIGLHSSCSISPTANETCQKCSTKYHDRVDAPQCRNSD